MTSPTSTDLASRTVTVARETDGDPARLFEILTDARNLIQWAPGVADEVTPLAGERWLVRKDTDQSELRVVVNESAWTVDYLRQVAPEQWFGAFLRVIPRPGGGGVVMISLPIIPPLDAAATAQVLEEELGALTRLGLG